MEQEEGRKETPVRGLFQEFRRGRGPQWGCNGGWVGGQVVRVEKKTIAEEYSGPGK